MRPVFSPDVHTLYLDNSVIGGYFDEPWQRVPTQALWHHMECGGCRFVVSEVTAQEILPCRDFPRVAHVWEFFKAQFRPEDHLPLTDEAKALAAHYLHCITSLKAGRDERDAQHIAICTLAGIGFLLSWNFHHLDNREALNEINRLHGLPEICILTPKDYLYETIN